MDTGDTYDLPLTEGTTYVVVYAFGADDNFPTVMPPTATFTLSLSSTQVCHSLCSTCSGPE